MNVKPYVSRYLRKENYQSANHVSPQTFSPHHAPPQDLSAQKRTLQQKQIQDLEQKVDIILQHNEKLAQENAELKRRLAETEMQGLATVQKERMSRYQIEDTENALRRVRAELQIKVRQCEVLACECDAVREAASREAEGLRVVIGNLTASLEQAKLDTLKAQQQAGQARQQSEGDRRLALKEQERRLQEEFQRVQRSWSEEINRQRAQQAKAAQQAAARLQEQRADWTSRKNALVGKLQETHNREISELREEMSQQFQVQLAKLAEQATERCRNQRQKAQKFIKDSLQGVGVAGQAQNESLRRQIKALQTSLENRKLLIQELTAAQLQRVEQTEGLAELVLLRRRLKEQLECLLRQNEALKIASAQKHDRQLGEAVRVYQDRLEVLCTQIKWLQQQNSRLRNAYENEVRTKIQQRRAWEVQAGQLKNLVRKLKVQLRGIQEEFKLNIEGIRDQNLTFSMTLMKSMVQDRDKASFFQEQNRKLRALYERHEAEVEQQKKQAHERIAFYQSKYQQLKQSQQAHRLDIAQKQEMLMNKLDERQKAMNEANKAERQHLEAIMAEWEEEKEQAENQLNQERARADALAVEAKDAREELQVLRSKLKQNEEHIERLRMQLEMAGVDDRDKDEAVNHWRQHYEGIILKLQSDKQHLNSILDANNAKIQQLVYRYRTLENELQKATISLQQRGQIQKKVIELGMDENLVKNMGEIWGKSDQ